MLIVVRVELAPAIVFAPLRPASVATQGMFQIRITLTSRRRYNLRQGQTGEYSNDRVR